MLLSHPGRILLTGGAGFIGSHLAEALLRRGARLAILDNLDDFYSPARKRANLKEVRRAGFYEFFEADITDPRAVSAIVSSFRPHFIIHLAARPGVPPSLADPALYERINVTGTLHLLEAARHHNVRRFLLASSSSVYGASATPPFSESSADLRPISPYAATKLSAELLAHTYSHLYRLPVVCLRFFTVYGPRQRPDLAIYKFLSLLERGCPLPVHGYGETARDYTYVSDAVSGILAALDFEFTDGPDAPFSVFNLGSNRPIFLTDLITALERASGRLARLEHLPPRPGDVPITWADLSRSERLLGYRPSTSLDEGLRRFVSWFRSQTALDPAPALVATSDKLPAV